MTSWQPEGLIGRPVRRTEDYAILRGEASYVADLELEGMLHAVFVRSTDAHAEIRSVEFGEALAMPGVVAVLTADDFSPDLAPRPMETGSNPLPFVPAGAGYIPIPGVEQPVLARGRVRYVGEAIAIVVAESEAQAVDAAELVWVDLDPLPAMIPVEEARRPDAPVIWEHLGTNVLDEINSPEPDDLFADADVVIEHQMYNQRVAAVPLETRGVMAGPHPEDGGFAVWSSTQQPHRVLSQLCELLDMTPEGLRVIAPAVGGGFGAKATLYPEELCIPVVALRLGRPVRWVERRSEHLVATCHGRAQSLRIKMGARADGEILAISLDVTADVGAYPNLAPLLAMATTWMAAGCYRVGRVHTSARAVATNTTPVSSYRGAGRPEAAYAIERAVELLSRELEIDPAELRRRNFIPPEAFPYTTPTGMVYDSGQYEKTLDKALELSRYNELREEQRLRRERGEHPLGIGLAAYVEITGGLGEGEHARVEIGSDGRVQVQTGTSPHGQGHETVWAQIAADVLGVPMAAIDVRHGDTRRIPEGGGTYGSRSAQFGGSAVNEASKRLATRIQKCAAAVLDGSPGEVVLRDGIAVMAADPSRSVSFGDLAQIMADPQRRPDGIDGDCLAESFFFEQDGTTFPSGVNVAVVEVDPGTGLVRLREMIAVDDCGSVLNPMIAEGQVHGGLAQGIGQALLEEIRYDDGGQPTTTTLGDYLMPTTCELPRFTTAHVETPSPLNPLGVKGIGESGTVASTPAVVNAVVDALSPLGIRDLELPLRPERLWLAMRAASAETST